MSDRGGKKPGQSRGYQNKETMVMPLSEILRQRAAGGRPDETPAQGGSAGDGPMGRPADPSAVTASMYGVVAHSDAPTQSARGVVGLDGRELHGFDEDAAVEPTTISRLPGEFIAGAPEAARNLTGEGSVAAVGVPQVVVFFSCKGGSGATLLGVNVAEVYARAGQRTCVLDLDLQMGDALAALALPSRLSISQAAAKLQAGVRLDYAMFPQHASGVCVLSQVGGLDDLDKISAELFPPVVAELRSLFDVIIVDGVRDFTDNVLAVLDVADKVSIVTVQEALAVRRARWAFQILRQIGFRSEDVLVILNRFRSEARVTLEDVEQMMQPAPVICNDNHYDLAIRSLDDGETLYGMDPEHTLTQSVASMARSLAGEAGLDVFRRPRQKQSWWSRLLFGDE